MASTLMSRDPNAEVGAYFDRCAQNGVMGEFEPNEAAKLPRFLLDWGLAPGEWVLEPGCGSGRLTERLAAVVGATGLVLALDLSPEMIARARRRGLPPQVRLHCGAAESVPAPDSSFDRVICLNVLPHFTALAAVLAELARVLVPGGHLWVNHFAGRDEVNAFHAGLDDPVRDHRLPPPAELRSGLEGAGFAVVLLGDDADGFRLHAVRR
jgi:SAM-dependent methyltransferase